MCGVIGASFKFATEEDAELVERVILQSKIRGLHATGITYLKNGELHTVKGSVPADEFLRTNPIVDMIDRSYSDCHKLILIAHTRYSTSDLRYNQPFSNGKTAIVHNGVVSQEPMHKWKYETATANDSELILRSIEYKQHPLEDFPDASMAVVQLDRDGTLRGYRNGSRPLWYASARPSSLLFASTKDILVRAGINAFYPAKVKAGQEIKYVGDLTYAKPIVMYDPASDLQENVYAVQ